MKRFFLSTLILTFCMGVLAVPKAMAYNFGDFRSSTLTSKAWKALKDNDLDAVLAYTNKCIELYGAEAKKMEASLNDYPKGSKDEIFGYWALNDVATCLFIQGEAYRRAKMNDEAKQAFEKLIQDYKYGQTWDPNGWFWKPANAAKEKLAMIDSGTYLDFGDYSSSFLTGQAWKALSDGNLDAVLAYTNKVLELYEDKAKAMQESLSEYPWQSKEQIFKYWALNDVGTCLYIQGEAYKKAGKIDKAKEAYKKLIDDFFYAQCWDPSGWFWKPAEAAQQALEDLN